eukprot:1905704-Amphidinium_carterae.1
MAMQPRAQPLAPRGPPARYFFWPLQNSIGMCSLSYLRSSQWHARSREELAVSHAKEVVKPVPTEQ